MPDQSSAAVSKKMLWAGRIITAIPVLFLVFDTVIHFMKLPSVAETLIKLGHDPNIAPTLAVIKVVCLILYLNRRTSVFGAILLTGYLGGAVATNLRVGLPLFSNVLFPVYIGILLWLGLWLRDEKLRELTPIKKNV